MDFDRPARAVHFYARGLTPIPLPFAYLNGKMVKFTSLRLCKEQTKQGKAGEVISLDGGMITVACGEGTVTIDGVLPEGKKSMSASDFIRGRGVAVGDVFTTTK